MIWNMVATGDRIGVKPRVARGPANSSSGGAKMASPEHIRDPIKWGFDQIRFTALTFRSLGRSVRGSQ